MAARAMVARATAARAAELVLRGPLCLPLVLDRIPHGDGRYFPVHARAHARDGFQVANKTWKQATGGGLAPPMAPREQPIIVRGRMS